MAKKDSSEMQVGDATRPQYAQTAAQMSRGGVHIQCTRAQFESRQRIRHISTLWQKIKAAGEPMFAGEKSPYNNFTAIANILPTIYLPNTEGRPNAAVLIPGMTVSNGPLTPLCEWLGTVDNRPALMTNLRKTNIQRGDRLRLYSFCQSMEFGYPTLNVGVRDVAHSELRATESGMALVDPQFADNNCGWALVHVRQGVCSTQAVITRCTIYRSFITEEALQAAASSFGGLKDSKRNHNAK